MQNQAFYRTGIFGNIFSGGGEFCVFKTRTGIPGGPGWRMGVETLPKFQPAE